ncbi:MAG: CHRD domain-containing protein [Candidatus Tectomicrobia bacterium]|uniref:CHRD domain-containing protein n=1 Tax=Tectimicrobiota bacterium TaxID=2528274 RepID=A0A932FU61_UNCTE|nr:CHRD domain-containing protein [Candidatus Tectomicrobia bacterium]
MSKPFRTIVAMAIVNSKALKVALAAFIASLLVLSVAAAPADAALKTFIAVLNTGQEFFPSNPQNQPPANPSNALGVAFVTFDTKTRELCYAISFTSLVATESAAHFHGPNPEARESAGPGIASGVRRNISPSPVPLGSPKTACVDPPLTSREARDLNQGLWYINVHSSTFPGGEIRGQVLPIK